jgi:hypothetical protein
LARKATELLQPLPMQVQLAPQGEGQKWSEMTEMDRIGQKLQRVIPSLVVLIIYFIYIIIIYIYHIYISYIYISISHIYISHIYICIHVNNILYIMWSFMFTLRWLSAAVPGVKSGTQGASKNAKRNEQLGRPW